jgi:hypothetical protein
MPKTSDTHSTTPNPFALYLSMFTASTVLQPVITIAAKANAAKISNQTPYFQALTAILKNPIGCFFKDSCLILKRRSFSSLFPATTSSYLGDNHNMTDKEIAVINTITESAFGYLLEPKEKFNLVNRQSWPLINKAGVGIDLLTADQKGFNGSMGAKSLKFSHLSARQELFKQNIPYATTAMTTRNGMFAAAAFLPRPLARDFIEKYSEQLEGIGIKKEKQENVITYALRTAFCAATTPFDTVFTRLCSGQHTAKQVMQMSYRSPRTLAAGMLSRTIQSFFTSTSIDEGRKLAGRVKVLTEKYIDQDKIEITPDKFKNINAKEELKASEKVMLEIKKSNHDQERKKMTDSISSKTKQTVLNPEINESDKLKESDKEGNSK